MPASVVAFFLKLESLYHMLGFPVVIHSYSDIFFPINSFETIFYSLDSSLLVLWQHFISFCASK